MYWVDICMSKMTMLFDFLKKIFGWVDEGAKKRKLDVSDYSSDEEEFRTPKRFKSNYNTCWQSNKIVTLDSIPGVRKMAKPTLDKSNTLRRSVMFDNSSASRKSTVNFSDTSRSIPIISDRTRSTMNVTMPASAQNNTKSRAKLPVPVIPTNSLRDRLATTAIMKPNFLSQVAKTYDERIEQRHKEAEELKKLTYVLSKHNRIVRENALGKQLARSMKLCLTIVDDREEPEEPALPKLTDDMLREIRSALVPSPPNEILAEGFGLRITRKDLHTLSGLNWLNDEVINFYMNLLIVRGAASDKYPKVHAMNTFFYPKLLSGGHSSLKRWTRKVDIFAQDLVVVPVHLDIHWCMSIIDFRDKTIVYYDSMGGNNSKCLATLKTYLQDESLDKKKQPYNMSDWTLQCAKNIPLQMNGSDCGVFSCMFAEYVCANKKLTFTQEDMPYFRNKMVYEILKGKLL